MSSSVSFWVWVYLRNFFKTPVFLIAAIIWVPPCLFISVYLSLFFHLLVWVWVWMCVSFSLRMWIRGFVSLWVSESESISLSVRVRDCESVWVSVSVWGTLSVCVCVCVSVCVCVCVCVGVCCHLIHPSGRAIELCFRCWGCTCAPTQDVRNRGTIKIFYLGKCVEGTFVHLDLRSCQSVPATILFWCGCGCGRHWVRKWVHSFFIRTIL